MPLSDWKPLPAVATGYMWTAAHHNTYIRQNQQTLYDALALGHGQGSNVDMLDGRHGTEYVQVDTISFTPDATGWWTIAEGDARRISEFVILDGSGDRHNLTRFIAGWAFNGVKPYPVLREVFYTRYNIRTIKAVRVLYDTNNAIYGTAKLQIYAEGTGVITYRIYRLQPLALENEWQPWQFVTPAREDAPAGYAARRVMVPGNGNWRLAKVLPGSGASLGWQSPSQMQSIFPPDNPSGWNPASTMDGNTSTGLTAGAYGYYQATTPIVVDQIYIAVFHAYASGGISGATQYVYGRLNSADNWQLIGTMATENRHQLYEKTFTISPPVRYQQFKVAIYGNSGGDAYLREFKVSLAAGLILHGLPVGSWVKFYDANGNLLESLRSDTPTGPVGPVISGVDAASVEQILITRPESDAAPWLEYFVSLGSVDNAGSQLATGDMLTLYPGEY